MRRTFIKGIQCKFLEFQKIKIPNTDHLAIEEQFDYVTQGPTQDAPERNLRKELWQIMCDIDTIAFNELLFYNRKQKAVVQTLKKYAKRQPEKFNQDFIFEELKNWPDIYTKQDLYNHYKNMHDDDLEYNLRKDVPRSDPFNEDFKIEISTGKNSLYNLLNAYAHFDPEIQYCQGMNILFAWVLKFMRKGTGKFVDEREILEYDEVNSFYIIIHIMYKHQYRHIYDSEISKINEHLTLLEEILQTSFPKVYHHLVDEMFINLVPIFLNIITTIFVADLQSKTPEIATFIFDVFLLDGESVIFTLLTQFIGLKQEKIL